MSQTNGSNLHPTSLISDPQHSEETGYGNVLDIVTPEVLTYLARSPEVSFVHSFLQDPDAELISPCSQNHHHVPPARHTRISVTETFLDLENKSNNTNNSSLPLEQLHDIEYTLLLPENRGSGMPLDYQKNIDSVSSIMSHSPIVSTLEPLLPESSRPSFFLIRTRTMFFLYGVAMGLLLIFFIFFPSWLLINGISDQYYSRLSKEELDTLPLHHIDKEKSPEMCFLPYDLLYYFHSYRVTPFNIAFGIISVILPTYLRVSPAIAWYVGLDYDFDLVFRSFRQPAFFAFLVFVMRSIMVLGSSISYSIYTAIAALLFTISSFWVFKNIEIFGNRPSFWKKCLLYLLSSTAITSIYLIYILSWFFSTNNIWIKVFLRIVVHPIFCESSMLFIRLVTDYLILSQVSSTNIYFLLINLQFYYNLIGRFLIVTVDNIFVGIGLSIVTSLIDLVFRSTTWFRDLYLFLKILKVEEADREDQNFVFAHYHLYYFDELSSYASIITAAFFTMYFNIGNSQTGSQLDPDIIINQTLIALTFEFGLDIIRTLWICWLMSSSFHTFFETSICPTSFLDSIKKKSFWYKVGAWWMNLDIWIHSFWQSRSQHFFIFTLLSYIGTVWFLLSNFMWIHLCFHPTGNNSFIVFLS